MLRLLALVAIGLSGYLVAVSLQQVQSLGCSFASFDCDAVLATQWSKVLGVPVAFLGVGCYLGIFLASWLAESSNPPTARWGIGLMALLTTSALVAGIWFTVLQFAKLGSLCLWCLGVHLCGLLVAIVLALAIGFARRRAPRLANHAQGVLVPQTSKGTRSSYTGAMPSFVQLLLPISLGMLGAGAMIGGQLLLPEASYEITQADALAGEFDLTSPAKNIASDEQAHVVNRATSNDSVLGSSILENPALENPATDGSDEWLEDDKPAADKPVATMAGVPLAKPPKEKRSRMVELLNGRLKLDIYQQAYIGSPEAPHVVVELFDYTCEHCRKLNENFRRLDRRYGDQVVVIAMPVPLEKRCNPRVPKARPQNRGSCKLTALALCAATVAPAKFGDFHDWLLKEKKRSRRYEAALLLGYKRFGRDNIRDNIKSPEIAKRIRMHINLYANLSSSWQEEKKFGLPVLIAGDKIASGIFDAKSELYEFLETGLGVEPVR